MELITHKTTQEEIMGLYHQVYQLKETLGWYPCSEETVEEIHIEILEALKEYLLCRWGPTQLKEGPRWRSMGTRTFRIPAQAKFHDHMQATYDHFGHFQDLQQESFKEALRVARDAHHQVQVAAALLEGHIERLGHSVNQGWSHSWGWSGSCWYSSRRYRRSHRRQTSSLAENTGNPARRQASLPSPVRLWRRVTFKDSQPQ